jgi:hypothetical protein
MEIVTRSAVAAYGGAQDDPRLDLESSGPQVNATSLDGMSLNRYFSFAVVFGERRQM